VANLIADGVHEIDTLLGGWERVTSGYLVDGDETVLVETGSQSSVPALLAALDDLGVGPDDLAHVVVTHIHLDHAGGVGDVARAFPNATVHVHEKGARHLVDPARLVDSAAMVYGDLLDSLYGRLTPTEAARVHVLEDGDELRVAPDRVLTTVDSPGHAKHHLALHDSRSGLLFVGDAVGVRLPDAGILRPATPPPDFDLDQALTSIARFAARRPTGIALAHYGLVPEAEAVLDEATEILTRWAEVAERAWQAGEDIAAALDAAFGGDLADVDEAHREKLETLNGIHSNAAGFRRWLDKRAEHTHPHPH
jgi:glyoxylase-like metal-dependent hydrolase (beta-lactamase superfamily II)